MRESLRIIMLLLAALLEKNIRNTPANPGNLEWKADSTALVNRARQAAQPKSWGIWGEGR